MPSMVSAHSAHAATPGHQRGRGGRVARVAVMVLGVWTRSGFWSPTRVSSATGQCGRRPSRERYGCQVPSGCLAAVFGGIQHLHLKGAKRSPKRPHERISRPSWGSGRHRSGGTGATPAAGCAPTASSPPSAAMQSAGQDAFLDRGAQLTYGSGRDRWRQPTSVSAAQPGCSRPGWT